MLNLLQNIMTVWTQGALVCLLGAVLLYRLALTDKDN